MPNSVPTVRKVAFLPESVMVFLRRRAVEAGGLLLFAVAAAAAVALASYSPQDPSFSVASGQPVANWLGAFGAGAADLLLQWAGVASVIPVLVLAAWAWRIVSHRGLPRFWINLAAGFGAFVAATVALAALPIPGLWPLVSGLGGSAGDYLHGLLVAAFANLAGGFPTWPVSLAVGLIASVLCLLALGIDIREWQTLGRGLVRAVGLAHGGARATAFVAGAWGRKAVSYGRYRREPRLLADDSGDIEEARREPAVRLGPAAGDGEATPPARQRVKKPKKILRKSQRAKSEEQPALNLAPDGEYQLPPLHLLREPEADERHDAVNEDALEQNARLLESVLDDYGVRGRIVNVRPGPVVTLYELEPAPGTKTSRVIGLADDIARSMSARSVRIAVVPGRNAIGIELPNRDRETVYLRELLSTPDYDRSSFMLPLALGKDIGGAPVMADLARMPHLLIAGTTGSGKSVAINTMILSLLYRLTPEQCRMIMIDPKMLELSIYDDIPHLLAPVVTDPGKAIMALKWTVREMENRYRAMASLGVRNISGYNQRLEAAAKAGEELKRTVQTGFDPETGKPIFEEQLLDMEPMPYIVVVVDEMADLMMVAGKDIEGAIQRLAQMARAAGIHLVMATQRPSVDVITGTIKANFPTRISFQVTAKVDSRTILGEQGAEQLLGQGDMLYMAGGGRISRVHGPFVSDDEVEAVVRALKRQGQPEYLDAVTEEADGAPDGVFGIGMDSDAGGLGGSDDLFDKAVDVVARHQKASTSFLQRQLKIGYNRAADLIDRMEAEGVIGRANHVGKREVLVRRPDEDM
jgi:S-DNA-T family DNA segregation ATPase FtsK/SpoIIIE